MNPIHLEKLYKDTKNGHVKEKFSCFHLINTLYKDECLWYSPLFKNNAYIAINCYE